MTVEPRLSLKGWRALQTRRRRELRAAGVYISLASKVALHEVRCRAQIAQIIGRPDAKKLHLVTLQGPPYSDPQFLLMTELDRETWLSLEDVPSLLRTLDGSPP